MTVLLSEDFKELK